MTSKSGKRTTTSGGSSPDSGQDAERSTHGARLSQRPTLPLPIRPARAAESRRNTWRRGVDAILIAALEADERDWKRFDREQARSERKELDDLERALDELAERARDLAREALTAAGYHSTIGANGGNVVSQDIVKCERSPSG